MPSPPLSLIFCLSYIEAFRPRYTFKNTPTCNVYKIRNVIIGIEWAPKGKSAGREKPNIVF